MPLNVSTMPSFMSLDLRQVLLQNHLIEAEAKQGGRPTWDTVRYMISQIQYGGRITDDFDQMLMNTYANKFFHQVIFNSPASIVSCLGLRLQGRLQALRKVSVA